MATNRSAPPGAIVPSLIYRDVGRAIDWLCDTFGFVERLRITGADGRVGHAQLSVGFPGGAEGGILLGETRIEDAGDGTGGIDFRPPRTNEVSQTLSVEVEDVDAHYAHSRQRGARILNEPTTYPYGVRQYDAFDLEGHRWTFSQTVADVPPELWGATART